MITPEEFECFIRDACESIRRGEPFALQIEAPEADRYAVVNRLVDFCVRETGNDLIPIDDGRVIHFDYSDPPRAAGRP